MRNSKDIYISGPLAGILIEKAKRQAEKDAIAKKVEKTLNDKAKKKK